MNWKRVDDGAGSRVYVLVAAPGDDALPAIGQLADEEGLSAAQLTAVGAFSRATVGWFDRQAKDFQRINARPA